jgi:polar amino acid transport system substrate-binding protein
MAAHAEVPLQIVSTEEAPLQYTENNEIKGVSAEILYELLKETGYEGTEIRMYPWARAYNKALNDENTMIFTISRMKPREKLFHWTCPLFEIGYTVYKLKSRKDIKIDNLEDIRKYRLGLWRDDARHHFFASRGFTKIDVVAYDELNIRKLLHGRIDLYVGDSIAFAYQMEKVWGFSREEFAQLEPVYDIKEARATLYIAFSLKTDEALRGKFAVALEKMKKSGKLQSILDKYVISSHSS